MRRLLGSVYCLLAIAFLILRRRRVLEGPQSWDLLFSEADGSSWAFRCKMVWLLAQARRLGDPYRIVRCARALVESEGRLGVERESLIAILDSAVWTNAEGLGALASEELSKRLDVPRGLTESRALLAQWVRTKTLTQLEMDAVDAPECPWTFAWIPHLVRAARFECVGEVPRAVDSYRTAHRLVSSCLPEARQTWEKISYLTRDLAQ